MATADSIPIIDIRLLSQSEINSLALSSPNAFNLDTLSDIVPKIDRSVFNESAGSRKQTYSRLPLFQSQSQIPSSQSQSQSQNLQSEPQNPQSQSPNPALPRRRGRPRLHPLPAPATASHTEDSSPPDLGREENLRIVSILKKLFESREKTSSDNNKIKNSSENSIFSDEDRDKEVRNGKGEEVDLAALAAKDDPFGEEIWRRTDGLRTEEQLLGYMTGLDGQWGSRRKKRKVVDAAVFGDSLPKGWKLLLGLKRKEGIVYLNCRRYVSPSGKQFMSCKEVSSYILSLNGQQDAGQTIFGQNDERSSRMDKMTLASVADHTHHDDNTKEMANCSSVAPISYASTEYEKQGRLFRVRKQAMAEPDNSLECKECNITFGDKDAHLQHFSAFHQRSAKRRKLGKSITDGVIVKDGKYECQFCHKTFTERHRYNGHIGAHIRYEGLGVDASPHDVTTRISNNPSSLSIVQVVPSGMNISANKNEEACTTEFVNNKRHIDSPQCIPEADMNEIKHSPKIGAPVITEAVASNCKKEIEHNPTAGAPEITEAISSENRSEHYPKEGTIEITEGVSSENKFEHDPNQIPELNEHSSQNKIEHDPKEGAPENTEAIYSENKIEYDPKGAALEITEADSSSKLVGSQSEDFKITCKESKEIINAQNVTSTTSNACMDVVSPCGTDMNNVSHTASPIMNQEPSTSQSVDDQINVCETSGDKSGVVEDSNVQDGRHNVYVDSTAPTLIVDATTCKTLSEASLSSSKSEIINCNISDHMIADYKPENDVDTSHEMNTEIAEEISYFSSKDKFAGAQINECDITGFKSDVVDSTDAMSIEANSCMDDLSPSLINVDNTNYENPNSIDPSSCTVISANENCNRNQKCEEHHLLSLSGNGPSYVVETYASDVFSSKVEERVELDTSVHDKSDSGSCHALTNKDTVIASTVHNELNTSYIFTTIASEPTSGIETNADCMFPGDLNKSLLEGIDEVGNELQNYFHSSNACKEDGAGIIMSNGDERQALQVSVADQSSSWVQSSNSLPILDLIPDQCQAELHGTVQRNEQANISGLEELRLGSIEPADFVLFTGQASGASGSVTRSPMELFPDDQLEWGMSLTKMVTPSVRTSVCVWCSREFSLEGMESEPQSESLGYMCPDCKAKISGQLGVLNNGFS